jgi:predicted transcriptional regulator
MIVREKGTMWLLQRLKVGEVMTQETFDELLNYIGQLEVSQAACKRYFLNEAINSIEILVDRKNADAIKVSLNEAIGSRFEPKKEVEKETKFKFSDRLVHRDVRYSEELDSALADLAHHNKTATNEVIVRLLEQAVKMPGFYGLNSSSES